jgi:hypothetical protein
MLHLLNGGPSPDSGNDGRRCRTGRHGHGGRQGETLHCLSTTGAKPSVEDQFADVGETVEGQAEAWTGLRLCRTILGFLGGEHVAFGSSVKFGVFFGRLLWRPILGFLGGPHW